MPSLEGGYGFNPRGGHQNFFSMLSLFRHKDFPLKQLRRLKGRVNCLTCLQYLYYDRIKTVFPNPYCYEICLYKNGNQQNVYLYTVNIYQYLLLLNLQVNMYSY